MSDNLSGGAPTPRRDLLRTAAGAAVFLGCGLGAAPAAADAKISHNQVHYQTTPKGGARCQACTQFVPSPACKLVADPISPNGWCQLYAAKT